MRDLGIPGIAPARWGTHFSLLYENSRDLFAVLAGYFATGLRNNEQCLWIAADARAAVAAEQGFLTEYPGLADALQSGQLDIRLATDWYACSAGLDSDRVLGHWFDYEQAALQRGFEGVRAAGDTTWLRSVLWSDFAAYQQRLRAGLVQTRVICLCAYSLAYRTAAQAIEVVNASALTLSRDQDRWKPVQGQPASGAHGWPCHDSIDDKNRQETASPDETASLQQAGSSQEKQDAEYRRLVQMLPVGVLIGRANRVEYHNMHAASVLGYASSQALSRVPLLEHIAQPGRESIELKFAALKAGQSIDPGFEPVQLIRADGATVDVEAAVIPLRCQDGLRKQLVFRDMTEAVRMQKQLEAANVSLKALSKRLIDVQETERASLARELHDEVGQLLTAMKIHTQSLKNRIGMTAQQSLDGLLGLVDRTLKEVRDLSAMLRPPQLDQLGLVAAVRWQLDTVFCGQGPQVVLCADALPVRPAPAVELAAFRIVQESITNIIRHADATAVRVDIRGDDDQLVVQVSDDGSGFDPQALRAHDSVGLAGMQERAILAGGALEIVSRPQAGTYVHAHFPLVQA